ncbi:unnamed protein product [Clonostachys byssicola]|uniref:Heterokaryon incompatibility domain-containing protein n=1 Tax=Clonostachys byssicola TaxID=160290 RepID=A0A9N9UU93_9HYPO|nr:unnamed protein product [Clonostachys byssicola]
MDNFIINIPYSDISSSPVSHAGIARCRYRFVECSSFVRREALRVIEFVDLPKQPYSTVSYVWRGLIRDEEDTSPIMSVDGAEGADPISIEVFRLACVASLKRGCELLWLDGLCIIQADDGDKAWQIQRMYTIYESCKTCVIIPGGLSRLTRITDETSWMSRAWTLQEAIAPPSADVLFAWEGGSCRLDSMFTVIVEEVEPSTAAISNFEWLLAFQTRGRCRMQSIDEDGTSIGEEREMRQPFGSQFFGGDGAAFSALTGALHMRGKKGLSGAIWRSSFVRSAKYPVDMVFSIMGILGVSLDTTKFSKDDRLGATVALMRELLARGERAEWLAIATKMEVNPDASFLPIFPKPSPAGKPVIDVDGKLESPSKYINSVWNLDGGPTGEMTDAGVFRFEAHTARIRPGLDNPSTEDGASSFKSAKEDKWVLGKSEGREIYAAFVGTRSVYTNGFVPSVSTLQSHVLMLLERDGEGRFYCIGYAEVEGHLLQGPNWSMQKLENDFSNLLSLPYELDRFLGLLE